MNELRQALEDLKKIARDNPDYTMDDIIDHINIKIVDLGARLDEAVDREHDSLIKCGGCGTMVDKLTEMGEIGDTVKLCEDCFYKRLSED